MTNLEIAIKRATELVGEGKAATVRGPLCQRSRRPQSRDFVWALANAPTDAELPAYALRTTATNIPSITITTPKELSPVFDIKVQAMKDGYVGQIIYAERPSFESVCASTDPSIVWETSPKKTGEKARDAAQKHLNNKIKELFA